MVTVRSGSAFSVTLTVTLPSSTVYEPLLEAHDGTSSSVIVTTASSVFPEHSPRSARVFPKVSFTLDPRLGGGDRHDAVGVEDRR